MKRQIIILAAALVAVAAGVSAQSVRRPPAIDTCSECPAQDSIACQLWPDACASCWATCGEEPGEPFRRAPQHRTYPVDRFAGGYSLPRLLAVTQVAHEDVPWRHPKLAKMTNVDFALEAYRHGFDAIKLWVEENPVNCTGPWEWQTPSGQRRFIGGGECYGEDMGRFWREVPQSVVILRPYWYAWSFETTEPDGMKLTHAHADYYAIAKRLFAEIGDRSITVVLSDWEQDWLYRYYPWHTLRLLNQRQEGVERARREAWLELGHRPALRVYHAAIINRFVPRGAEPGTTLAEQIPSLDYPPDFVSVSYWQNSIDPAVLLDWVAETTGYPKRRIFIDEFGGDVVDQVHRFEDYVPAFFDWGARLVGVWMWQQGWCDPENNRGLWLQAEPCAGTPIFTEPSPGYYALRRLRWAYQ